MKRGRRGFRCRHHMENRVNGGNNHKSNKLLLYVQREQLVHLLFGNKDQYQILDELRRMNRNGSLSEYIRRFERLIRAKEAQSRIPARTVWEKIGKASGK